MNREKVYTAPFAEMLLLVPAEELAGTWGYNSWNGTWYNGTFTTDTASGLGIIKEKNWLEDGYDTPTGNPS